MRSNEPGTRVFRSLPSVFWLGAAALVTVLLFGDAVIHSGLDDALLLAPWLLLAVWVVYVLLYLPHVRVDDDGVRVHGVLRIVDIPWGQITDIRLRWQLEFELASGRTVTSWGGPTSGRPRRAKVEGEMKRVPAGEDELEEIRERLRIADQAGAPRGEVRRSWDRRSLIALAVIVGWAVAALAITGGPGAA